MLSAKGHRPAGTVLVGTMEAILSDASTLAAARPNIVGVKSSPTTSKALKVLFLCADNAISSIMAEALLRRWGGGHFYAFSAGIAPRAEIDSFASELLKTYKVWIDGLHPKHCDEFLGPDAPAMDFIVSVGSAAPAALPARWPGHPQVIHWRITDPVVDGTPVARTRSFQAAFRELETRIKLFVLVHQRDTTRKLASAGLIGGSRAASRDRASV